MQEVLVRVREKVEEGRRTGDLDRFLVATEVQK